MLLVINVLIKDKKLFVYVTLQNTEQPIPDIQGNILLDNYNNYNPTTLKPYQFIMIKK